MIQMDVFNKSHNTGIVSVKVAPAIDHGGLRINIEKI